MSPHGNTSTYFGYSGSPKNSTPLSTNNKTESDPYDVLGVPRDADANLIKSAYRKLALKHHPDKIVVSNSSSRAEIEDARNKASSRFAEISAAYRILSDTDKKKRYDHICKYGGGPSSEASVQNTGYSAKSYHRGKRKVQPYVPTYEEEENQDAAVCSGSKLTYSTSVTHVFDTPDGLRKFVTVTTQFINGKKSIREETICSNGTRQVRINTNADGTNNPSMINDDGIRVQAALPEEKVSEPQSAWSIIYSYLCPCDI